MELDCTTFLKEFVAAVIGGSLRALRFVGIVVVPITAFHFLLPVVVENWGSRGSRLPYCWQSCPPLDSV